MKNWKAVVVALGLGAIAGLAAATLGKQEASAVPCCGWCEEKYQACLANCNGDPACEDACGTATCIYYCNTSC